MTRDDGVRQLLHGHDERTIEQHKARWSKVVRRLRGHALALSQARAYLQHKNISIEGSKDFLTTYEANRNAVLQNMPREFWESKRIQARSLDDQNMVIAAFTTFEMLFQEAADQQMKARIHHFLTLSAFFEPTHIGESVFECYHRSLGCPTGYWMDIFTSTSQNHASSSMDAPETETTGNQTKIHRTWDRVKFWDLIRHLHNTLSILHTVSNTDSKGSHFSLHPLIRDWIQVRMPPEDISAYTNEAVGFVHASVVLHLNAPTQAEYQRLVLTHLDASIWNDKQFSRKEHRLGHHPHNLHIARTFSNFYKRADRWGASLELSSAIMETRKQYFGDEHQQTLQAVEHVAMLYTRQTQWEGVEELQKGVIAMKANVFGPKHLETLASTVKLADIYLAQRRLKEAETQLVSVLEKRREVLEIEHIITAQVMMTLVQVHMLQHSWEKATELCSTVIAIRTEALGPEHQDTITSLMTLAALFIYQGKRKEAAEIETKVRSIRNKTLGTRHVDTISHALELPSLSLGMSQEEVEELLEQTRKSTKRVPGAELSDTRRIQITRLAHQKGVTKDPQEILLQGLVVKTNYEHSEPLESTNNITYSSLKSGRPEIRLLTVSPGCRDDKILCRLDTVSLDDTPAYTALSYCWGKADERGYIFLHENMVSVTKSLEIGLRHARNENEDVVLWVDAICINQENLAEKSAQVRMMGRIYASGKSEPCECFTSLRITKLHESESGSVKAMAIVIWPWTSSVEYIRSILTIQTMCLIKTNGYLSSTSSNAHGGRGSGPFRSASLLVSQYSTVEKNSRAWKASRFSCNSRKNIGWATASAYKPCSLASPDHSLSFSATGTFTRDYTRMALSISQK
jgi:hypothetical protein